MSAFPNVIFGRYGDEKKAQSTTFGPPLGSIMQLPDGKQYIHAKAQTSAVLAPGKIVVAGSAIPDHGCGTADNLLCTAAAIGATTIVVTAGGTTAIATDYYAGGDIFVRDDTGEAYTYKVKVNNSAATGSTCTVTLEPEDPVVVAIGGTATAGLRRSPYGDVLTRATGSALVGQVIGVPVAAVSAGFYCWLQKRGLGPALVSATIVVIGQPVFADTAVAGAVAGFQQASTATIVYNELDVLGHVHAVSGSAEYALVNWCNP